jgi:MFS family permease
VVAAAIIWRLVPETRPEQAVTSRRSLLPVAGRDVTLLLVIVINIVYAAVYFQGYSTLPLAMADDGLSSATYGLVIALNGVVIVLVQPFVGRYLRDRDRSAVLAVSMLLVGLGFGLGALVHSWWGYGLSVVVWTFGEIGFAAVFGAIVADLAPVDLRGGYMGLTGTAWGFGSIIGPLLGTAVLEHAGDTTLWAACAVLGLALFAAQLAMGPTLRRRATQDALTPQHT